MMSDTVKYLYKAERLKMADSIKGLSQLQADLKMAIEDGNPVEINRVLGMMQLANNKAMWSYAFTAGIHYATDNNN